MDWKLELVVLPVTDVDRAKEFYTQKIGFVTDHDQRVNDDLRFVKLTPPGSACSIAFGDGLTTDPPGSYHGLQMVVPDIEAAHAELEKRGAQTTEIEDLAWGSFVYFDDPDGNRWAVQQIIPRNAPADDPRRAKYG